jgi:formylglycine-generating enzyme required for sulfatase activity
MSMRRLLPSLLLFTLSAGTAPAAEPTLTIDLGDGVKMELVLVKKGTYRQGSPPGEAGRGDDETQRQVTLTHDFYLGKYPVTRGQFERFVRDTGYRTEAERGTSGGFGLSGNSLVQRREFTWRHPGFDQTAEHPVVLVTYSDAQAFLRWLAGKAGRRCTLPTEAQWEYACRAASTTPYYNGRTENDLRLIAGYKANTGDGTRPVGRKNPNAWGLHDMAGNVWEWCADWYGPYAAGPVTDPEQTEPPSGEKPRRVLRGGSWFREAKHCRSADRYRNDAASRNADNGFRVLAAVEPEQGATPPADTRRQATEAQAPPPAPVTGPGHFGGPMGPEPPLQPPGQPPNSLWDRGPLCCGLLCLVPAGVVAILLFRLFRRPTYQDGGAVRTPFRAPDPGSFQPRVVADGFWLDTPALAVGSVVRYRCLVDGEDRSGDFTVAPGPQGQFVYTGGTPTDVEILEVLPPPSGGTPGGYFRPTGMSSPPRPSRPITRPSPPPFTGFPSAY